MYLIVQTRFIFFLRTTGRGLNFNVGRSKLLFVVWRRSWRFSLPSLELTRGEFRAFAGNEKSSSFEEPRAEDSLSFHEFPLAER